MNRSGMHVVFHDFSPLLNFAIKKKKKKARREVSHKARMSKLFWIDFFLILSKCYRSKLSRAHVLGASVSVRMSAFVKLGGCFFLCLNANTEKWSGRGRGWLRKLTISQSERMPLRACALFAPLATHANLSVNLHLHKETTLLHFLQLPFICFFFSTPILSSSSDVFLYLMYSVSFWLS